MIGEINNDFYCSAGFYDDGFCRGLEQGCCKGVKECSPDCSAYHRKHPTPEQFKQEYGFDYSDDDAVYVPDVDQGDKPIWVTTELWDAIARLEGKLIVCACTPFGKPDNNWRPE